MWWIWPFSAAILKISPFKRIEKIYLQQIRLVEVNSVVQKKYVMKLNEIGWNNDHYPPRLVLSKIRG